MVDGGTSAVIDAGAQKPRVGVVIVTYNSADHVAAALGSLAEATCEPVEILVVDNNSVDGTVDLVRKTCPEATVIEPGENLGFARACNLGSAAVEADLLLFLNPDSVLDAGSLDRAIGRLASDPNIGMVGGRTRYADGSLNATCCFAKPTLWSAFCYATGLASLFRESSALNPEAMGGWDRTTDRFVDVITGCFLLIRTELFHSLRGFDERFFLYSEDTDLSQRVRALGLRCLHMQDVGLVHVGGGSDVVPSDKLTKVFRARQQYYDKHWSPAAARMGVVLLDLAVLGRLAATRVVAPRRHPKWRAVWGSRAQWHGHQLSAATPSAPVPPDREPMTATEPQLVPPVRLHPHPIENRARIGYRVARHVVRSVRRRDYDFVAQGLATAVRLPLLTGAEVIGKPRHECNVCGWTGPRFYPNTGPGYHEQGVTCPGCSSLDRHRSLLALLLNETEIFHRPQRVVEVAPMRGFEALLTLQPALDYTSFDLERHAMERGDITAMKYPTASTDWFICFHVLEHIPDDQAALREIRRVLKPGGSAVLQVPVDWQADKTREYDAPDPREVGHVRCYGSDFGDRLTTAGFEVRSVSVLDVLAPSVVDRFGLSPEPIFFARKPSGG
jgi:GT2 family glycosyltransferase/SAM-dependent methyltransferase